MRFTPPQLLRTGAASLPRGKGREKLPEPHPYCVPAVLGGAFPISTISPGNKDWINLLKRHLETSSFVKVAVGHMKSYFKSAELTGTYAVLVSNRVAWELTKPPQLSSVARVSSKGN
jgi:hypothetical protein